ncbi:hypothetical protein NDU88_005082 [Pleurodeles waltl]|uniref:Uncharacterized protein n=1 Tax=Pleurodeles waltl TaxID=8319 RepID=A0AAV7WTQ8_PLEWA|nr:hypothetical protein NDU88_005082 [Pleurodeles waltl]
MVPSGLRTKLGLGCLIPFIVPFGFSPLFLFVFFFPPFSSFLYFFPSVLYLHSCCHAAGPNPQRRGVHAADAAPGPAEITRDLHHARGSAHGSGPGAEGAPSKEARARAHPAGQAAPEKELPRQKIRGGSSTSSIPRRSCSRSGAEAHQLGRGRARERHTRSTSLGGADPSDRRKEAQTSPNRGQRDPGGDRGNPIRWRREAARPPIRAAGSDGRGLQPRRRFSDPGDSPRDRATGT